MPANKHKRKATPHIKNNASKKSVSQGLITSHPKSSALVGISLIALGVYLLAFKSQSDAMFGVAMLALISGGATTIYANLARTKKKMQ